MRLKKQIYITSAVIFLGSCASEPKKLSWQRSAPAPMTVNIGGVPITMPTAPMKDVDDKSDSLTCVNAKFVADLIARNHIRGEVLEDSIVGATAENFIDLIDSERILLSAADKNNLTVLVKDLFRTLNLQGCYELGKINNLILKSAIRADQKCKQLLNSSFVLQTNLFWDRSQKSENTDSNMEALVNLVVGHQLINLKQTKAKALVIAKDRFCRSIQMKSSISDADLLKVFLRAYARAFDPSSDFISHESILTQKLSPLPEPSKDLNPIVEVLKRIQSVEIKSRGTRSYKMALVTPIPDSKFNTNPEKVVRDLIENALEKKVSAVVLDLRLISSVVPNAGMEIASLFLKKGIPAGYWTNSLRDTRPVMGSRQSPFRIPLLVILDPDSGGAAEVIAASLQDYDMAFILGPEKTQGASKSIQLIPLRDNLGQIYVANQENFRLNKKSLSYGIRSDFISGENFEFFFRPRTQIPGFETLEGSVKPIVFDHSNPVVRLKRNNRHVKFLMRNSDLRLRNFWNQHKDSETIGRVGKNPRVSIKDLITSLNPNFQKRVNQQQASYFQFSRNEALTIMSEALGLIEKSN